MKKFDIKPLSEALKNELISKIDNLTKPKGSLGVLEKIACQIGAIQQTLSPSLKHPCNILFAADHGIEREGVSKSPREITWQQMYNFLDGGAGICFLCRQHNVKLVLVDAGVDYDLPYDRGIINLSMGRGTKNFLYEGAMTLDELNECLKRGAQVVDKVQGEGCNIVSFGEMGIANTSPSSVWMHYFGRIPLKHCIGAGSGLDNQGISHKQQVLTEAVNRFNESHPQPTAPEIIAHFGGYEMVMAIGGMLRAAELRMPILIDGFIMSACILAASKLHPEVLQYAIFTHQGDESGHRQLLESMGAKGFLHLDMRLGEGTGAVCAYPIIESAIRMINEMPTFKQQNITKYFD